ncbi:hypothetical protein [Streptomyces sp. NPDC058653]|uniref:hypothetical protein n=1 Tax=Streptomyces sp. NPDC058653 TaxID=3346576 RepID=UPI00366898D1
MGQVGRPRSTGLPVVAVSNLVELGPGAGKADLKPFDLAEPALFLRFGDAGNEVVADLDQPAALGGVGA